MTTFSVKEFNEQTIMFRDLMGDKKFWERPENQRQAAVDGYAHVYFSTRIDGNVRGTEEEEYVQSIFWATMTEYTHRESMLMVSGLVAA